MKARSARQNIVEASARAGTSKETELKLLDVAKEAGMEMREFIPSCNKIQKRLDIDIGVAALIVLRDHGVDISTYADEVYEYVRKS